MWREYGVSTSTDSFPSDRIGWQEISRATDKIRFLELSARNEESVVGNASGGKINTTWIAVSDERRKNWRSLKFPTNRN